MILENGGGTITKFMFILVVLALLNLNRNKEKDESILVLFGKVIAVVLIAMII